MTIADQGLGTIIAGLENGGGGGGGLLEEVGSVNVRMVRLGEVTNGTFDELAQYCTLFGTGNDEGSFIAGNYNVISGGDSNIIDADWGTVGGGRFNRLDKFSNEGLDTRLNYMTVAGGYQNYVQQKGGTVGGGYANGITSPNPADEEAFCSTIGGGYQNGINGHYGSIAGGRNNHNGDMGVFVSYGTIAGGANNYVRTDFGSVGGGSDNAVNDQFGTVGGGQLNQIIVFDNSNSGYQTISGGYNNLVCGRANVVSGGFQNVVGGPTEGGDSFFSNVSGGHDNTIAIAVTSSSIAGGEYNVVATGANYAHIAGGENNMVDQVGGQASGMKARSRMPAQRAFAGSQETGDPVGSRQASEFVFRGNTSSPNETVSLQTAGPGEVPSMTFFQLEDDKTYAFTAECVARAQADSASLYATVRGAVHLVGSSPTLAVAPDPNPLSMGAPSEWSFFFDFDEAGMSLKFTVGAAAANVVGCTALVRMVEVGPYVPG